MDPDFFRQQKKSKPCLNYGSGINNDETTDRDRSGNTTTSTTAATNAPHSFSSPIALLNHLEDDLHNLWDEWATVDVVLNSIKNAYPVQSLDNAPEELLDDVDRELCIAYDEVRSQARQLSRNIERLEAELEPHLAFHNTLSMPRRHRSSDINLASTLDRNDSGQSAGTPK